MLSERRMHLKEFTSYIVEQFQQPTLVRNQPNFFELDERWKDDIIRALKTAPKGNAIGSDLILLSRFKSWVSTVFTIGNLWTHWIHSYRLKSNCLIPFIQKGTTRPNK